MLDVSSTHVLDVSSTHVTLRRNNALLFTHG